MLQDQNRLKRKRDFDILFEEGRFYPGVLVNAKVWKVDPVKYPKRGYGVNDLKIGIVAGLKVSKNAVQRNRVKRQMREVIRLLLKEGAIRTGYMVALVAKPEIVGKEYRDIQESLQKTLRQARLLV